MFQTILVPVDLSDRAVDVVRDAAELARIHRASVTLLHVIETVDAPFDELRGFYQELEAAAQVRLTELAAPLGAAGLTANQHIQFGKRTREIIAFAEENRFDLVVVGSHRLTPENFASGFMTTSHQVAIGCQVPVLVVKR
jgi:nucleotide-binding universal stress UspA family protein